MKLIDILKKRPYVFFIVVTIILSLLNYYKNLGELSELPIEFLKGLPIVIILIETQKKRYVTIAGYIMIFLALFSNIFIFVLVNFC